MNTPIYFNGHNYVGQVILERAESAGWITFGLTDLFSRLTSAYPRGDAIGRHDVSAHVEVDGNDVVISNNGKLETYPIKWI